MRIQICMNTIMIVLNLHRHLDGFNGELVSGLIVYNRQKHFKLRGGGGGGGFQVQLSYYISANKEAPSMAEFMPPFFTF